MPEAAGTARGEVIGALADAVAALRLGHPVRVGIDGCSCAGKTTLADELADALRARGSEVVRASFDDFHGKGHTFRSEWTPQSYFDKGYDYGRFLDFLLRPLGPLPANAGRQCCTAYLDRFRDELLPEVWQPVRDDAIAVVDGIFLFHPQLADHWDFVIWLDVDVDTLLERAYQRDGDWHGSREAVERRYRQFRLPIHQHYERLTDAPARAHAVIDNRDLARPRLLRLRQP